MKTVEQATNLLHAFSEEYVSLCFFVLLVLARGEILSLDRPLYISS
jgi:hypothetical protein